VLLLSRTVLRSLAVGADEERVAASTAAGMGRNRWKGWSLLLLESRWRRGKIFFTEKREGGRWCKRHVRLLECLAVMKVVVGGTVAKLVAAKGVAEKEKAENDEKQGRKDDFLSTLHSSFFLLRT